MSCSLGDKVIVEYLEEGWYTCLKDGVRGLVPKAYVKMDKEILDKPSDPNVGLKISERTKKTEKSKEESKKKDKSSKIKLKKKKSMSNSSKKKKNEELNQSDESGTKSVVIEPVKNENPSTMPINENQNVSNSIESQNSIEEPSKDGPNLNVEFPTEKRTILEESNEINTSQPPNTSTIVSVPQGTDQTRRTSFGENNKAKVMLKGPPPKMQGKSPFPKFSSKKSLPGKKDTMPSPPMRRETIQLVPSKLSKDLEDQSLIKDSSTPSFNTGKKFPTIPKRPDMPKLPPKPQPQSPNTNDKPLIPPKSLSSRNFTTSIPEGRKSIDSSDLALMNRRSSSPLKIEELDKSKSLQNVPDVSKSPIKVISQEELDQRRFFIVKEILSTEISYISGLEDSVSRYFKPLLEVSKKEGHENDVKSVFSTIEHILPLNKTLLKSLEEKVNNWSPEQTIGDVFLRFAPFLKMYTSYSNNYDNAIETLSKISNFPWFTQIAEHRHKIESVMITPIQRIPRYNLLLTDLFSNTQDSHRDKQDIAKALELMKGVASHVNTSVGIHKNIGRLTTAGLSQLLAPHRVLLRDGTINVMTPENEKVKKRIIRSDKTEIKKADYHFLLFNDTLVYVNQALDDNLMPKKEKKGFIGKVMDSKTKTMKRVSWPLYLVWLKDIGLSTGFDVFGPTTTFTMFFQTVEERNSWWHLLKEWISKALSKDDTIDENAPTSLIIRKGKYFYNDNEMYEGEWKQGVIHGKGVMQCFGVTFEGDFEGGFKTGKGIANYQTGQVYTGHWKDGKPQDHGKMVYPNQDVYEGDFKEGKRHGKGVFKFNNLGSVYEGEWRHDQSHGQGHLKLKNGNEYTGSFVSGRFNGNGVLKYHDGSEYNGSFINGMRQGKGLLKMGEDSYDGDWKYDKKHGVGTYISSQLGKYEGEWKNDMREGKGIMKFKDRDTYEGLWSANRPNGHGVWEYKDGYISKYDGEFSAGRRNGKGIAHFNDGCVYEGDWMEDLPSGLGKYILSNGTTYDGKWHLGCLESKISVKKSDSNDKIFIENAEDSLFYNIVSVIPNFDFVLIPKHLF